VGIHRLVHDDPLPLLRAGPGLGIQQPVAGVAEPMPSPVGGRAWLQKASLQASGILCTLIVGPF
jgi:hypothetical protein